MSHNSYYHGSDSYVGHCPKCDRRTGTCHDELCEDCFEGEPVECPLCGEHYQPDQMHGSICQICYDNEQEEKAGILADVGSVWAADH